MPESVDLTGSLCNLRTTVPADGPALVAIRSTEEVRSRWRGDDLVAEFAEELADDDVARLTIEAAGQIIGLIQFAEEEDADYRHASLDIYVDPALHRQGYGSDAIRTLAGYLFNERGHHRLTIDPAADNHPAIRCYASVGFGPVGVMREYERRVDGSWGDGLLMEMLANDRPGLGTTVSPEGPEDLEKKLLSPGIRGDSGALEALLHPDFVEIGASGRYWTREEIVADLVSSPGLGPMEVADLGSQQLAVDAVLVSYTTISPERTALRSSLWIRDGEAWRIRFHQGTVIPPS